MVQAGTAISSRLRGELNSLNIFRFQSPNAVVDTMSWDLKTPKYALGNTEEFDRPRCDSGGNGAGEWLSIAVNAFIRRGRIRCGP